MKIHEVDQRSEAWYKLRTGMPTASEFSKLVTSVGNPSKSLHAYACTLAAETFAGRPIEIWEGNTWTERGKEMENAAISLYVFAYETSVTPVGFVTDDTETMGCSPDGFVGDDGLVEVKALKAERHVQAILYWRRHGRCPPDYVQQAQGQMLITGRAWCDLVFYHPELPLLVIRQTPDEEVRMGLMLAVAEVIAERDDILDALRLQANPKEMAA